MMMLNRLREATEELHRELEGDNLANKIVDHSIDLEEYKLLLYQNYLAYSAVEKFLVQYIPQQSTGKSERLKKDLSGLGVKNLDNKKLAGFTCNNEAEAIGAAYVIEGSAMGGMLIGKEVINCSSLSGLPSQNFFNGKRDNIKGWSNFLKFLRSREFTDSEKSMAAAKAQETFELFEQAFKLEFPRDEDSYTNF